MFIFPRPLVLVYISKPYFYADLFPVYNAVPITKYFYFKMTWNNTLLNSENLIMHLDRMFRRLNDK